MQTHTLSNGMRQFLGAVGGMAIAGLVYVGIENASDLSIKGLLVEPGVISENAGRVRVNDKTIDDEALRRIAGRAATVAKALGEATLPPDNATRQRAEERREARQYGRNPARMVTPETVHAAAPQVEENALHAGAALPSSGAGIYVLILSVFAFVVLLSAKARGFLTSLVRGA